MRTEIESLVCLRKDKHHLWSVCYSQSSLHPNVGIWHQKMFTQNCILIYCKDESFLVHLLISKISWYFHSDAIGINFSVALLLIHLVLCCFSLAPTASLNFDTFLEIFILMKSDEEYVCWIALMLPGSLLFLRTLHS